MTDTNLAVDRIRSVAKAYYLAKGHVLEGGYAPEVDWQYEVSLDHMDESCFLREAAWVILAGGMSEHVIRMKFPAISQAFFNWHSARVIVDNAESCRTDALHHFGNLGKINGILAIADHVNSVGLQSVTENLLASGVQYLQQFPYLGPATAYHLAKNIGLLCAKPDRHLCRIADSLGYDCVQQLCIDISNITDEPIPVIDIVLWRFATLHRNYLERFSLLFSASEARA